MKLMKELILAHIEKAYQDHLASKKLMDKKGFRKNQND